MLALYYVLAWFGISSLAAVGMGLNGYTTTSRQMGAFDVLNGMLGLILVGFAVRAVWSCDK